MPAQEKATASKKPAAANAAEAYRFNTLGVAYMNQQRSGDAQKYFEQALAADPKFAVARLNLGISLMGQQKLEAARAALEEAAHQLPQDPYAWYNLGLVYKDLGETEKGIAAFQHVTEITQEADAYYFLGYLNTQLQKYDEAIAAFQEGPGALFLSCFFGIWIGAGISAQGGCRVCTRASGAFSENHNRAFGNTVRRGLWGSREIFAGGVATQLGRGSAGRDSRAIHAAGRRFRCEARRRKCRRTWAEHGSVFLRLRRRWETGSFSGERRCERQEPLAAQSWRRETPDVTQESGIDLKGSGLGCAAGDFDNDGHTDLAVCLSDGVRLLHNKGDGKFEDVTERVGIRREKGCVGVTFVDYDHDGDLDLYVTMSADSGSPGAAAHNILWRNNGNSTFTEVTTETGLGIAATGGGVVTTDFNNDRAIDFVFAGGSTGASIYLNPREGKFTPLAGIDFRKENLPPALGVVAFDFDKDGWMDLAFTHAGAPGISLWRNVEGKRLERVALPDFVWQRGWGIAAIDYDNDGWLDLIAAGETNSGGELRLLRNLGSKGWSDVTKDVRLDGVKLNQPRAIAVADIEGHGAADLVVTQLGGAPLILRNEGGNKNNWMRIDLKALNDNKSGIGTKVELYAGTLYQKWEVAGASGYLGQSALPILAGLGSERNAEVIRLLWPTGVPQDEINLAGNKAQSIAELDRRGSSCPVLFSWNGREYEFIADMIGPGVVGHWVAPGERDVPDPDEYLKVSAHSVKPRNGMLSFRFMEPMEETVYLDQVRLLAIDHPAEFEVYPNERFVSAPPFPEFRVITSRDAHPPVGAWDDRGNDVLALLSKRDRKYVTDFEELPLTGFAKLHWVELDLGAVGREEAPAIDHRWLYGLFHGDFDVCGGSGGNQSDRALRGSAGRTGEMGARSGGHGISSRSGAHDGGGLDGKTSGGNATDSHR